MLDFIVETETVWDKLKNTSKPIVLYGMGNGADKILDWCEANQVKVQGIFASDEFVRYQQFRGFTVVKYQDLLERLGQELLVVIAFASELPEVLQKFKTLAEQQECLAPHLPLFPEKETVSIAWLKKHEVQLQLVYDKLADDWSRRVFADTLNYKLSGKISYLFHCETNRKMDLKNLFSWKSDEVYLDLGAYNGDTVKEFLELTQERYGSVVAVEPDRRNCRKLRSLAENIKNLQVVEKGIWSCDGELGFSDSGGRQSTFVEATKKTVAVTTIDTLMHRFLPDQAVTYIKMDLEGCENQALAGAEQVIVNQKPKMFVAAYHYDRDIYELPLRLWQLVPEYKLYLRKHPYVPAWELNFFCISED